MHRMFIWVTALVVVVLSAAVAAREDGATEAENALERFKAVMAERESLLDNAQVDFSLDAFVVGEPDRPHFDQYTIKMTRMKGRGVRYDRHRKAGEGSELMLVDTLASNYENALAIVPSRQYAQIKRSATVGYFTPLDYRRMGTAPWPLGLKENRIYDVELEGDVLTFKADDHWNRGDTHVITVDTKDNAVQMQQCYTDGVLWRVTKYSDYRDGADGSFFPRSHTRWGFDLADGITEFDPSLALTCHTVKVENLKLDFEVPEGFFQPAIPDGYKVYNSLLRTIYTAGAETRPPDAHKTVEAIVDDVILTDVDDSLPEIEEDAPEADMPTAEVLADETQITQPQDATAQTPAARSKAGPIALLSILAIAGVVFTIIARRRARKHA